MSAPSSNLALALYYLHPRLTGDAAGWQAWLAHAKGLGFTHVVIAPPFDSGSSDDLFLTAEPLMGGGGGGGRVEKEGGGRPRGWGLILSFVVVMNRLSIDASV